MSIVRFAASVVLTALTVSASAAVAQGQTTSREVLIGVSRGGTSADPTDLFDAATAQLRGGNQVAGQRQLEQLVARFPDSDSAVRARQILAPLYAPQRAVAGLVPASGQISHLGAPLPPAESSATGGWRTTVRPAVGFARTAQEGLRDTAGDLVFFSEGSDELGGRARKTLAAQAEWLQRNPGLPVIIEGHADETGSVTELRALAAARAEAVRKRLIEQGIAPERITVAAFGNDRRVAICADLSCASQNRRAATVVGTRAAAQLR